MYMMQYQYPQAKTKEKEMGKKKEEKTPILRLHA